MSEEHAEVVRKPLRVRERSSRTLDQRLAIRFPKYPRIVSRLVSRLPPRSRLRQAALWRTSRLGIEAFNRQDFEAVLVNYHPGFEFCPPRELADLGIVDPSYRGHAGYLRFMSSWFGAWGAFRFEPQELIDLGDRAVILAKMAGRGGGSGVVVDQRFAAVYDQRDGMVIRQQDYFEPAEALEAVGLHE
jgi:ketosteroid isomerase-like protein